jgi:hypothetical protein
MDFIQGAAWIKNEKVKVYGLVEDDRGETTQGASVITPFFGARMAWYKFLCRLCAPR